MINPVITVREELIYGQPRYRITSEHMEGVMNLSGLKTLGAYEVKALKKLGFTLKIKVEEKEL